jgi:hypothetical protein
VDTKPRLIRVHCSKDSEPTAIRQKSGGAFGRNSTIKGMLVTLHSAAVLFLVKSYQELGVTDWNTYAIFAIIELARKEGKNPDVPRWIADDYFQAIRKLAEIGTTEMLHAETAEDIRAMLSVIAIEKGLRTHGRFLVNYSETELIAIESRI